MVMGYWSVAILFWQLWIDHIVNVLKSYIKDVDLPRHAWDTPPFLLIVSPTPPLQSVDAFVCTYARSIRWQPNEKRLTIFHEYGALSHAHFALRARGSPATKHFPCGISLLYTYWVIHPFARFFMYFKSSPKWQRKRSIYVKARGKNYKEGKDMKLGNYK